MASSVINNIIASAERYPDKVAIKSGHISFSYAELLDGISFCAAYLKASGISRGDRVSLLLENSIDYVVSYYGAIVIGAIVVPLNTTAKSEDIRNWLEHSGSSMLITSDKLYESIGDFVSANESLAITKLSSNVLEYSTFWEKQINQPIDIKDISSFLSPDMPVSIMYTSGTTGKPKGVTLTHGNFRHNFENIINYLDLTSADVILNVLPFYYSYGNSILHTHMMVGATLILENNFMYPVKFLQKIPENNVTSFSGVPATFAILLNRTTLADYDLRSLRYVTQAGGAMPASNIKRFIDQVDNIKFFVMYGQTEATARLTYLDPDKLIEKMGSVGKPLNEVVIEIRDENGEVVDAGVEGEVFVSGPNVMACYWNNAVQTNEVLKEGFLRTGDLGYMDSEGYIYLSGRRSDMIKVGGNRISPLEIEEVVNQLDGILEVAASGMNDELLGQVVKLSVVKNAGSDLTEKAIKAYCKKNLAIYKIPKIIEFVESLPKTSSGKIKRYLL